MRPFRWLSISRAERSTSYFIRPIRLVFSTVASDYPSFAPVTNAAQTDERHNREREDCGPSYCSESHLQTTPQFRAGLLVAGRGALVPAPEYTRTSFLEDSPIVRA